MASAKEIVTMLTPIVPAGQWIPPGLSQAVLIKGGNLLVLSGHVSVNSDGAVVGSDVESQLLQTFENMAATLKAAGADFHSVARLTYYIVNYQPGHLQAIRSVRDRFINLEKPPASTLIGVATLALPNFLVEVDAIAVVP
jgi:2-iminobutanoate/2-iminopropanoate deaminase